MGASANPICLGGDQLPLPDVRAPGASLFASPGTLAYQGTRLAPGVFSA